MSNLTFKRNIGKGKLLPKYMRESESEKVSRLLDGAFSEFWFNNLPKCHGIQLQSVNNPFNLSRLVYENEISKGIRYIGEGLIVTYPTKKFIDSLLRGMRTELPYEIKKLTFGDIDALDYGFGPDEVYLPCFQSLYPFQSLTWMDSRSTSSNWLIPNMYMGMT